MKAKELVKVLANDIKRLKDAEAALNAAHEAFSNSPEVADEAEEYLNSLAAYGKIRDALMERDDAAVTLRFKVEEAYSDIPRKFRDSFSKSVAAFYREAGL